MKKTLYWFKKSYIAIILSIIYLPLIMVVFLSFTNPSIKGNLNLNFDFNNGQNWLSLFHDDQFLNALFNTFVIIVFTVPFSTCIAVITCFGIWNAKNFYKNSVMGVTKLNMVIPDLITGISLALLFSITIIPLGANLGFATIILAHISFSTPYAIIIIYPRILKMKKNLILASMDLGYGKIYTFFKVIIPFLAPSIISAAAMVFSISFDDFIITKLIGGDINTISTEMYSMAKGIKMWAVTFGAIIVLSIFVIASIIGINRYMKEKKYNKKIYLSKYFKNRKNNKIIKY